MTLEQITKNGFKPLRTVLYGKKIRGGVVGYHMTTKENRLYVGAIYEVWGKTGAQKPTALRVLYGEPCPLPGFSVYLRKSKDGKEPGIYNMQGERVALELVRGKE